MNLLRHAIQVAAALVFLSGCGKSADAPDGPTDSGAPPASEPEPMAAEIVEIEPGLSMRVLAEGNGDVATAGQVAVVHYTGWLFDPAAPDNRGAKFDSSLDRDQHFRFPIGGQRVIKGWDRGVAGMKIGEKRELTIAPELAYGDRDLGIIPPGSTLVFEIDLAGLEGAAP